MTVEDGLGLSGGAPGGRHWAWLNIVEKVKVTLDKNCWCKLINKRHKISDAHHELLWHEATSGLHLLEDEVRDQSPIFFLTLSHQAKCTVVHLDDHLQAHEIDALSGTKHVKRE